MKEITFADVDSAIQWLRDNEGHVSVLSMTYPGEGKVKIKYTTK